MTGNRTHCDKTIWLLDKANAELEPTDHKPERRQSISETVLMTWKNLKESYVLFRYVLNFEVAKN